MQEVNEELSDSFRIWSGSEVGMFKMTIIV